MGVSALLVVDDEEDIRISLAALIHMALPDVVVETAGSGEDGIAALAEHDFDVVLSDFKMPGMNGVEFLEVVRRNAPRAETVLMTAFPITQIDTQRLPGLTVIAKPFNIEQMVEMVSTSLAHATRA